MSDAITAVSLTHITMSDWISVCLMNSGKEEAEGCTGTYAGGAGGLIQSGLLRQIILKKRHFIRCLNDELKRRRTSDSRWKKTLFKGPDVKELKFYKYIQTYICKVANVGRA